MSGWQPIETAPGDFADSEQGPPRLLVWVANGGRDGNGCVDFGWVYIGRETGRRLARAAHHTGPGTEITHWMPEPKAPGTESAAPALAEALAELNDALEDGLCNSGTPGFDKGRLERAQSAARAALRDARGDAT